MENQSVILVTGGAGFIGSNLCESLLLKGDVVICLDNFDNYYKKSIKERNISSLLSSENFYLEIGDIRDVIFLKAVFSRYDFDAVVHLAAKAGVRGSIDNIKEYYDVNVSGAICLFEVMKEFNVLNIVFASSSSVYGNNNSLLIENANTDCQISPYASTKKTVELFSYTYFENFNFNIINLRLFSVYGKRQRPDLFLAKVFKAISNKEIIKVYGDGEQLRDFTYITDVVDAFLKSLDLLSTKNKFYEIINIGSNTSISVNELINIIEREINKKINIRFIGKQVGDIPSTFAGLTKASKLLNYEPKIKINEGIKIYKSWYNNSLMNSL